MNRFGPRTPEAILVAVVLIILGTVVVSVHAQDAAALYKTKCAACHGGDGKGETAVGKANKIRDLASEDVQKQSDTDLTATITNGKNKMPAYGKSLKADQVKDLVAYVRSLAKK